MTGIAQEIGAKTGGVAPGARARQYPAGTDLFQQGFAAEEVVVVIEGVVKLLRLEGDGRQLIVGLRHPGSILGAAPVVAERAHPVTARTVTACTVRHVSASAFRQRLRSDPATSWELHQALSREVCEQAARLSELACCTSRQRLELALRALVSGTAWAGGTEVKLHTPLKHREIAELIAVTPEQLSRLLREMEDDGLVRREKGWVILRDVRRLTRDAAAAAIPPTSAPPPSWV